MNLIVGEYYIKKIISRLRTHFPSDKELDLKFKIIRVLILKELESELFKENMNQVLKLKETVIMSDKSFLMDLNDRLIG